MRLVITVLLLIVLPTAFLSVLAGRSIQARELILERRLAQDARVRLDAVAAQTDQYFNEVLAAVNLMFRETVLSGTDIKRLDDERISRSAPPEMVRQTFLFMNPWGFIFPETGPRAPRDVSSAMLQLQPALINALAGNGSAPPEGRVMFDHEGGRFCFEAITGYDGLFAGVELNGAGIMRYVEHLLETETTPFLRYTVRTSDSTAPPVMVPVSSVEVSDSLGMHSAQVAIASRTPRRQEEALAVRRLNAPFDHLEIGAFTLNMSDILRAQALQLRLIRWGILLLAVVIIASAFILIAGALRQAETARRRSEFMAGMSHDLRTPVAAMRMMAESLQAGRVADETRRQDFLDAIVTECDRLGDLIERIMFYFRQEQGVLRYDRQRVAAESIAAGVVERFRRQHAGRIRISFDAPDSVPPVFADANALEKALTNLIDNAVKYGQRSPTDTGTAALRKDVAQIDVSVSVHQEHGRRWTVLAVRDRGDGIAAGEHHRIFERFYRVPGGAHAHRGGFGLGLSLVADIVKAHQGRIRVANAPDGGAVFEIWLRSETDGKVG